MPTDLAALATHLSGDLRGSGTVVDVTHDSRAVQPGTLFCAVPGFASDGHDFAAQAITNGASGLLVERWLDTPGSQVAQVRVPSVRRAMGPAAARVHGDPSDALQMVAITGTNGKTTTTYLVESVVGASGQGTGVIGTVETRINGQAQSGGRTTPEGPDLQRLLRAMLDRGVDVCAMEVSSHGLDLHRVDGTRFAVAVFTNLTQDHLDHHGTMEAYFAAKARLFTPDLSAAGIVNIDDAWGRRLAAEAGVPVQTYGFTADADHRIVELDAGLTSTRFRLAGTFDAVLETRLLGAHNAANAAAAYLAARAIGIAHDVAAAGIAACRGVPGRLESVVAGQPFAVLVDYAHTPDALDHVIGATRALLPQGGRLHIVVGCGGDRDRGKRPLMGASVAAADHAVLTSDNPRSEDPADILAAIAAGAADAVAAGAGAEITIEVDRRVAIGRAIAAARSGDIVVIAGKGHETGQEFADRTVPFDDRVVAGQALAAAGFSDGFSEGFIEDVSDGGTP